MRGADEPEPGLVNQRGRLQRVAGGFVRHLVRGQATQFVIDQWKQFPGGFGVALLCAVEAARHFAHGAMDTTNSGRETVRLSRHTRAAHLKIISDEAQSDIKRCDRIV
jgi:hypothetical protein